MLSPAKINREGHDFMEHEYLGFLRETAVELIKECEDADLLDLLCKLLAEEAGAASSE